MLTQNQKRVLRFLATRLGKDQSINEVAKACSIAPNGAYKILAKLEREGVLKAKQVANIKSYTLNFEHEKTVRVLELALIPDTLEGRIKARADDLQPLKPLTQACVLFGSYITAKQRPGDLDILFILERTNFEAYKQALAKVQDRVPVHVQDVVQTRNDIAQNLKKNDPVVIAALRHGVVLWGFDALVKAIKHAAG